MWLDLELSPSHLGIQALNYPFGGLLLNTWVTFYFFIEFILFGDLKTFTMFFDILHVIGGTQWSLVEHLKPERTGRDYGMRHGSAGGGEGGTFRRSGSMF